MENNKDVETIEDIYLQKSLLRAAAALDYEIKNQEALDSLVFVAKQCMPDVFMTIIKEYKNQ